MRLSRRALGVWMVAAFGPLPACADEPPKLVALHGCGLEQQGELTRLRVVVRGDFAPSGDTELVLGAGDHGRLNELPAHAAALTVEGLIGDFVAAVGRTRGVQESELVAYFAPPNSLCSVPSNVTFREHGGVAVDGAGELLWVGGRDAEGMLLDELVLIDLDDESGHVLEARLAAPTAGQTLHFVSERSFVMIGGARSQARWFSTVSIDLERGDDPVGAPVPLEVSGQARGVAHHGAALGPDGRVLVAGGCESIDTQGACATAAGDEAADVSRASFWFDAVSGDTQPLPDLGRARFDATVLVARDGVAFVAGGRDGEGVAVASVERLLPGADAWEPWGDELGPVAGATLLEHGLLVLVLEDGSMRWLVDGLVGDFDSAPPWPASSRRPLLETPGERVLADAWLVPVGSAAASAAPPIDLVAETPAGAGPGPRVGPTPVALADGTALLVGGRTTDGAVAVPFLARARPTLDGPDERIPDVAGPEPDAFVLTPPGAGEVQAKDLVVIGSGSIDEFPRARAHVRGFRSHRFAFDFVAELDDGRAHVLLSEGAQAGLSLRLDPDGAVVRRRQANGDESTPACEQGVNPRVDGSLGFSLEVSADAVTLSQGDDIVVRCAGWSGAPAAVGLGVSGTGTLRVRQMRLRRR